MSPAPTNVQPVNCATCRKPFSGYFEIMRVDSHGMNRGSVRVCSLPCLLRWGYNEILSRGVAASQRAGMLIDELLAIFKGPPQPPASSR